MFESSMTVGEVRSAVTLIGYEIYLSVNDDLGSVLPTRGLV
jgi:hypothetical protein